MLDVITAIWWQLAALWTPKLSSVASGALRMGFATKLAMLRHSAFWLWVLMRLAHVTVVFSGTAEFQGEPRTLSGCLCGYGPVSVCYATYVERSTYSVGRSYVGIKNLL